MKNHETIDNLLTKAKNKFLLSNAIAGRAKQIAEGSLPYVDNFDPSNPIITAIREIGSDKIKILSAAKKKPEELFINTEEAKPEVASTLERLAKEKRATAKKEKKKK